LILLKTIPKFLYELALSRKAGANVKPFFLITKINLMFFENFF